MSAFVYCDGCDALLCRQEDREVPGRAGHHNDRVYGVRHGRNFDWCGECMSIALSAVMTATLAARTAERARLETANPFSACHRRPQSR